MNNEFNNQPYGTNSNQNINNTIENQNINNMQYGVNTPVQNIQPVMSQTEPVVNKKKINPVVVIAIIVILAIIGIILFMLLGKNKNESGTNNDISGQNQPVSNKNIDDYLVINWGSNFALIHKDKIAEEYKASDKSLFSNNVIKEAGYVSGRQTFYLDNEYYSLTSFSYSESESSYNMYKSIIEDENIYNKNNFYAIDNYIYYFFETEKDYYDEKRNVIYKITLRNITPSDNAERIIDELSQTFSFGICSDYQEGCHLVNSDEIIDIKKYTDINDLFKNVLSKYGMNVDLSKVLRYSADKISIETVDIIHSYNIDLKLIDRHDLNTNNYEKFELNNKDFYIKNNAENKYEVAVRTDDYYLKMEFPTFYYGEDIKELLKEIFSN